MSKNDSIKVDSKDSVKLAGARPDVRELMAEIRQRVKKSIGENRDVRLPFVPHKADDNGGPRKAGEILHSEELRYLNQNHHYPLSSYRPDLITSHRPGLGKLIVKAKRAILHFFWQGLFKPYFEAEREYQTHLVRLLNDLTKYIDSRDAFIFWDLIKKIDCDVNRSLEQIESIADTQNASHLAVESELREQTHKLVADLSLLADSVKEAMNRLGALESTAVRLEGEFNRVAEGEGIIASSRTPVLAVKETSSMAWPRLKTSSDESRFDIYASLLAQVKGQILDISQQGSSLHELLKKSGIESYQNANPISHLESLTDQSLGGVVGIKALDRMKIDALRNLLVLTKAKVRAGGIVLFEMTNPESLAGYNIELGTDPSLVTSLSAESFKLLLEFSGFRVREIHNVTPFGNDEVLKELEFNEYLTPKWGLMIESLNGNIRRLNALLYGHKSYCIVAEV